jgi:BirA family biotin operon repressor/biotin-[acetyl-CoA-carboxylase] ligase
MRNILWFESCGSTMVEAARLAAEGAPHFTVVGADEQTAGQGRLGRRWHSERGAGLYVSVILRIDVKYLTLTLGVAAVDAIGNGADLRWPNDVLIGGKKIAGILVNREPGAYVAGIGINVNHTAFPEELNATSLRMVTGVEQDRDRVLDALLRSMEYWLGRDDVLHAFAARSTWVRGKSVEVEGARGVTDGLDASGFLWLRLEDGSRRLIVAGGVREAS